MYCEEIMKRNPVWLSPGDSVQLAARKMRDANVGFLPVCDPSSMKILGAITDRDIVVRLIAENRASSEPVSEAMSHDVVSCRASDDVTFAEQQMSEHKKSRILCTDATGRLVGVISLSDLAQVEEDKEVADTLREITEREAQV
jgi:CBS domain-containing protein